MTDEALFAAARQANEGYRAGYERRLATEIAELLRNSGADAERVLAFVDAILNMPVARPPQPGDAA